jgi:hypothetical protein
MREETTITVNWVTDGVDRCRVGFLPKSFVATGSVYDGVLCQIVYVGSILSTDKAEAKKFHAKGGFALASVILPLREEVAADNSYARKRGRGREWGGSISIVCCY